MIEVEGEYPVIERFQTGILSLDMALSNGPYIGAPLRVVYEIFGKPGVGKSTLTYYLSGKINKTGNIYVASLESFDRDYVVQSVTPSGFEGKIKLIDMQEKGKTRSHEAVLTDLIKAVTNDDFNAGIFDSIGALIPTAEMEGELTDANMGVRARLVSKIAKKFSWNLINSERMGAIFIINHQHEVIGGMGHTTAGGVTLKYHSRVRMGLWSETIKLSDEVAGYLVHGTIEKLSMGKTGRKFQLILLPGYGISPDLSAMFDCFELGLAKRDKSIQVDGQSLGYLSKFFEAAREGRTEMFAPFYAKLEDYVRENKLERVRN